MCGLDKKLRILYAEDESVMSIPVSSFLRKQGIEVVVESDGHYGAMAYAAAIKEGKPFDLVLTDSWMGGACHEEGLHLVKFVRAKTPQIPIIVTSESSKEELAVYDGLVQGYCEKSHEKVYAKILEVLGQKSV